ncbi:hypothetical protein Tco_1468259 [Tanacetum coccineum]
MMIIVPEQGMNVEALQTKLYDSCGVHHVSTEKGIYIYMLIEKEYPLSRGTLTHMLVAKLLVEQDNEISRELLRKIFMQNIRVILHSIHSDDGNPSSTNIKQALRKWELKGIPCKHVVAPCYNIDLNDQRAPPLKAWVNPCYWLTTWRETYSHKVGRLKKKRKRSKHEDEPFVKDGGNNAEVSGSASRQEQQEEHVVGQDGSDGREMGDGIPTQSSAAGGASEWSILQVCLLDSDNELLIPTSWSNESKNEKKAKRKALSEAVEQGMDAYVRDEIDGVKGEKHSDASIGGKKGRGRDRVETTLDCYGYFDLRLRSRLITVDGWMGQNADIKDGVLVK